MRINPISPIYRNAKRKRENDKSYLAWMRTLPCAICKRDAPSQAAHVRLGGRGGMGIKPLNSAVPLCAYCHGIQHSKGHEYFGNKDFWLALANEYYKLFEKGNL